jgi:hypothetical protein
MPETNESNTDEPIQGKSNLLRFEPKKNSANIRIDDPGVSEFKLLKFEKKKPQL